MPRTETVAYMFHGERIDRAPGVWVLDEQCALRVFGSGSLDLPICRENVGPYSQTCHECDRPIVKDGWCELFVKPQ